MKTAVYGLSNGIISIVLFEIINSVGYLNGKLSTTLYAMVIAVTGILCFVNYKLTKELRIAGSIRFGVISLLASLISIIPSIIIVGLVVNRLMTLVIQIKLAEDDMGAGILMIVVIISYCLGIVASHLLSCGIKAFMAYLKLLVPKTK